MAPQYIAPSQVPEPESAKMTRPASLFDPRSATDGAVVHNERIYALS